MFISKRFAHVFSAFSLMFLVCLSFIYQSAGHAEVTLDGTLGPQMTLGGPDFQIKAEYGKTINASNIFHSFGNFSIDTGQSANFTGPDTIKNIIGRVTGGTVSTIDGLVRSDISSANLYLLNPSGFLWGPNAHLDVNGSFHVTTSDYLSMGNNGIFYADPLKTSVLTIDPPTAFGFMGGNPGSIVIEGSHLEVLEDKTISLMGGDIRITGVDADHHAKIIAPGGRIDMAGVSSPGEIVPDDDTATPGLNTRGVEDFGSIDLNHAGIDAGGNGGGTVFIRSGRLVVDDGTIYASNRGTTAALPGNGVDIKLSGDLILDDSIIGANVLSDVAGDSGGIRIHADHIEINNSYLQSVVFPGSSGQSGDIEITGNSLLLENRGIIQAGTLGSGNGGAIIINANDLKIWNESYLFTNVSGGTGDSGDIDVTADQILMGNDYVSGPFCFITSQAQKPGTGNAGNIILNTNDLQMLPCTEISSATFYLGQAGTVDINAKESIDIQGTQELLQNGNPIHTGIFGNTWGEGNGGSIEISARNLNLSTNASIQVSTYSTGDAGNAILNVGALYISDDSLIHSTCFSGTGGDGGLVDITADSILISGLETSVDPFGFDGSTGISTASGPGGGTGGDIDLKIRDLTMAGRASIDSNSYGPDSGGNIKISADNVQVLNGSHINAGGYGTGDGGSVMVDAQYLIMSGCHPESFFDSYLDKTVLASPTISSEAGINGGNGGQIALTVETIEILDGACLSAETTGAGSGGNINIASENLIVSGTNDAMQKFLNDTNGNPLYAGSHISAGTNSSHHPETGNGGEITIQTSDLLMEKNGWISSHTTTTGKGGDITISTQRTDLTTGAQISTESRVSENAGNAGNITVATAGKINMDNASLLTSSEKAMGGDIKMRAGHMIHLVDSEITASVGGGVATTGGNVSMDSQYVILKNSKVIAKAFEGTGGNIAIDSNVFLADPDTIIDASSSLGIDGQVDIRSPVTQINSQISPLSKDFRSIVSLLRKPCMARVHKGKYSSFMVKGRDSLPAAPGRLLSSPLPMR